MNKENKDEKIQVLLSSIDHNKLKRIILNNSILTGNIITSSAYVRTLIISHIKENEEIKNQNKYE